MTLIQTRRHLLALLLVLTALPAAAGLFDRVQDDSGFLEVDEAFIANALVTADGDITATWDIAQAHYLYRHAFKFELVGDTGTRLGEPRIPDGEKHHDEFFGEVETYRGRLEIALPIEQADKGAKPTALRVTYQGCADAGLCYPPQTRNLTLQWAEHDNSPSNPATPEGDGFVAEQDRLAGMLDQSNLFWVIVSFFGLGILLAFTPCILPMIPILSGIIVGQGEHVGAGRGFALSLAYVLAMSAAYTVFGVLAGFSGANLQAALQSPWVLTPFALLFVALALAMFGAYQMQLPAAWQSRLNEISNRQNGGLTGAAVMGFLSALIVGPCLAPPLAGALLYIGQTGDAVLGGIALFTLGLGMGLPLLVLGTVGGGALPRAGAWMDEIKIFFGVVLIGVAIWLMTRILPGPFILVLWASLLAGYGMHLRALETERSGTRQLAEAGALVGLACAVILLVGAALGATNPLRPLAPLAGHASGSVSVSSETGSAFKRLESPGALRAALQQATANEQPAVVDFYADWCVECVQMEHGVFSDPAVQAALDKVAALQIDVTDYDSADRKLMRELGVLGPPTLLFFAASGEERENHRLIGKIDAQGFIEHLNRALGGS